MASGLRFCETCGEDVTAGASTSATDSSVASTGSRQSTNWLGLSRNDKRLLLGVSLAFLILAGAIVAITGRSGGREAASVPPPSQSPTQDGPTTYSGTVLAQGEMPCAFAVVAGLEGALNTYASRGAPVDYSLSTEALMNMWAFMSDKKGDSYPNVDVGTAFAQATGSTAVEISQRYSGMPATAVLSDAGTWTEIADAECMGYGYPSVRAPATG